MTDTTTRPRAVTLLSGGLDSTTASAIAAADGFDLYALTIDYNQRHRRELAAAHAVAAQLKVKQHIVLSLDLRAFGGSSLTSAQEVPKDRDETHLSAQIPNTYVPARNTIFLSLALGWAETLAADAVILGANALDYSGYPDCRPDYIAHFEQLAQLATKAGAEGWRLAIKAPLLHLSKAEIVQAAHRLNVDLRDTWSCYDPAPDDRHCGHCDSCHLRQRGFIAADLPDPTRYAA